MKILLAVCFNDMGQVGMQSVAMLLDLQTLIVQQSEHTLRIEFVSQVADAIRSVQQDTTVDVLLCLQGTVSVAADHLLNMLKKPQFLFLVHPLPKIDWQKVAQGVTFGAALPTEVLGLEYNVNLTAAEPTGDPEVVQLKGSVPLQNFKATRTVLETEGGITSWKGDVHVYVATTGALHAPRDHVGCVGHRSNLR